MQRVGFICGVLLLVSGSAAGAAESLQTVKAMYAAAAYEDALAALNTPGVEGGTTELQQYRVFCLVALGRQTEAENAMEALIAADPLYVFDPAETSPRVQEVFNRRRQQLLPEIAKRTYTDARGALDRKERGEAISQFERLLTIIDSVQEPPASLSELRVLASGFLDLSRALPAPAPARASEPAPGPAVGTATATAAASPSAAAARGAGTPVIETRPVALKQTLPPWNPPDALSRRATYSGALQITIDATGRVIAAEIVRGVHPLYDGALLRAAREWLYEPSRRNDVPISADLLVEINLQGPVR
jgi:TonB family protein